MLEILTRLFDPGGFPARWKCGVWSPELGWLHIASDLGVWSAYTAIPIVLVYFAACRRDLPFRPLFWLFGAFILLCGTTHLMEAVIFWWPGYRLAGVLKFFTAVVSWATVFALAGVVPRAFALRAPEELEREVLARRAAEAELVRANSALEERVRERTEELRAERERFRTTLASIGDSVVATDRAGRVTFLNPAAEAHTGWEADAALGQPVGEVLTVVSESTRRSALTATMRALTDSVVPPSLHDAVLISKNGARRPIDSSAAPIADGSGGSVLVFRDVTERRRAESALKESEARFRAVADSAPVLIALFGPGAAGEYFNRGWLDLTGHAAPPENGALARGWRESVHPTDLPVLLGRLADLEAGGECPQFEFRLVRPGGECRWLLGAGTARRAESGAFLWSIVSAIDVTERKVAEGSLERSNRLYRLLAEHMQDVVMLLNRDGEAIYASPSAERFNGAKSFAGGLLGAVHPEDRPAAERAFAGALAGVASTAEWRYLRPAGESVWAETALTPVRDPAGRVERVVASGRDVSARKRLEDELRQADKLQAVGRLAAGVAHDFNNLLTVVNGCADLLAESLPPASVDRGLAEDIAQAGARGATLTRQLLAFSRQQMMVVETFDPNALVRNCSALLRRLLGDDIELSLELGDGVGCVRADRVQLEQVVWNLAVNARDAMPSGGTLSVSTSEVEFGRGELPAPDAQPGRYVRLAVADTGTGMPPEVLARLFEPFFTTKPVGQGTGLGLATVYGIVRQSQGFLTVASRVGEGTTVAAHLPTYQTPADPSNSELRRRAARGSEVVLVVEDDEAVRAVTTTVLRRHGYRVVAADSGPAALEVAAAMDAPPDLLLTDVVMPRMGGRELAERLTELHPALKVGFLSGYTADSALRDGVAGDRVAFLQKPFSPDRLARFVRGILDQTDSD